MAEIEKDTRERGKGRRGGSGGGAQGAGRYKGEVRETSVRKSGRCKGGHDVRGDTGVVVKRGNEGRARPCGVRGSDPSAVLNRRRRRRRGSAQGWRPAAHETHALPARRLRGAPAATAGGGGGCRSERLQALQKSRPGGRGAGGGGGGGGLLGGDGLFSNRPLKLVPADAHTASQPIQQCGSLRR